MGSDELVTNGDFATDSDWLKSAGWTIGNGVASGVDIQRSDQSLSQSIDIEAGQTYRSSIDIVNYAKGFITVETTGSALAPFNQIFNNGTHTSINTSTASTTQFYINGDNGTTFTGSIDNVSIKRLIEVA